MALSRLPGELVTELCMYQSIGEFLTCFWEVAEYQRFRDETHVIWKMRYHRDFSSYPPVGETYQMAYVHVWPVLIRGSILELAQLGGDIYLKGMYSHMSIHTRLQIVMLAARQGYLNIVKDAMVDGVSNTMLTAICDRAASGGHQDICEYITSRMSQ